MDSVDYLIDSVNEPKYAVRHIHSLRENLVDPEDLDHRDSPIEISILQSSFRLDEDEVRGDSEVPFRVVGVGADGLLDGYVVLVRLDLQVRVGERVWTSCSAVLFGVLLLGGVVVYLDDGVR